MAAKRYSPTLDYGAAADVVGAPPAIRMDEARDGAWVKYEDYTRLKEALVLMLLIERKKWEN